MCINVDDKNSYPNELIEYCKSLKDKVNLGKYNDFNVDIPIKLLKKLEKENIKVYHCTRTDDISSFKKYGILIPNKSSTLKNNLIKSYNYDLNTINSGVAKHRGNTIHFVYSYKFLENNTGVIPFLDKIGGEISECTQNYKKNTQGIPYVLEFIINLSDVNFIQPLVEKMIRYYLFDITIDYEDFIFKDVKPEKITKYINATEVLNKLKEMI